MPANLSPEYKAAEAAYRQAHDLKERLEHLREMLRTIPKHKGTEHLQADIKSRIRELSEESGEAKKHGGHHGPATVIRPEGAAQIALLGPPNSGKSALHARLTGSHAESAPYPFTTQFPQPGMLAHEDIHFQLIDLPPVSPAHPVPWLANALQHADACLLVVDLASPTCVDEVTALHAELANRNVTLTERWDERSTGGESDDPFAVRLPALMIVAKADQIKAVNDELGVFQELTGLRYPVIATSTVTGEGLGEIAPWLFAQLGIVRVYTKEPGHPPDKDRPFTVRRGQTVGDVARLVHRELVEHFKYARLWRHGETDGQHVGREHAVEDGDVVELHG
jgi:ribosome-interacting GTPase 1